MDDNHPGKITWVDPKDFERKIREAGGMPDQVTLTCPTCYRLFDCPPGYNSALCPECTAVRSSIGRKDDADKTDWSLMPWKELEDVANVLTYGAKKYAPDNWKHVENHRDRYFSAAMRHVLARRAGELADPESGLPHLAHAVCCLLFLMGREGE